MFNTIFPKIHKEGYKFLAISIFTNLYCFIFFRIPRIHIHFNNSVGILFFLGYPERYSINDDSYLVSPADGLITDISEKNWAGRVEIREHYFY